MPERHLGPEDIICVIGRSETYMYGGCKLQSTCYPGGGMSGRLLPVFTNQS